VSVSRFKTEYLTVYVKLTPDPLGFRRKVIEVYGDVVYIDVTRTTADRSFLWIGIEDLDLIQASLTNVIDIRPHFFKYIKIEWSSVNDNKDLVLVVGREASLKIEPPRDAYIVNYRDMSTVANDYDLLVIDLSVARSDVLIASNVVSLAIISATSGATYSIKLFDTTKPALDQDVLKEGVTIERLNRAKVYLSNSAQSGASLKILVLKG